MYKIPKATKARLSQISRKDDRIGYYVVKMVNFLMDNPDFNSDNMARIRVDDWRKIGRINYQVNHREYSSDVIDEWVVNAKGDCEDKVFAKMIMLREIGIHQGAMSLAICDYHGRPHANLWLHTTDGDYALELSNDVILPWNKHRNVWYRYVFNSGKWFTVDGEVRN